MAAQQFHKVGTYVEFSEDLSVLVRGGTNIEIVRKRFGSAPDTSDYKVIRPLVNFGIFNNVAIPPDYEISSVELLVRFTKHDLVEADKLIAKIEKEDSDYAATLQLVFAYYIESTNTWVKQIPNPPDVVRHHYSSNFPGFNGFGGYDVIKLND